MTHYLYSMSHELWLINDPKNHPEFYKRVNALNFLPIVAWIGTFLMARTRFQRWSFVWSRNCARLILIFNLLDFNPLLSIFGTVTQRDFGNEIRNLSQYLEHLCGFCFHDTRWCSSHVVDFACWKPFCRITIINQFKFVKSLILCDFLPIWGQV